MPLIGNKVIEKDLRDHLEASGYYGRSAEFSRLELVGLQRPGWLQVFAFEVRAKEQGGDWVDLFGACRDDERVKTFDVVLTRAEAERDKQLAEFSDGLITLNRDPRTRLHFGLVALCVLALGLAAFVAVNDFLFGRAITTESLVEARGWSQWGGADRNFRLPGREFSRDWNDSVLSPAWTVAFEPGCGFGGVVVHEGVVFTIVRDDESEVAIAVDATNGRKIWEQPDDVPYKNLDYGMGPYSTPLVQNGTVYFLGATGKLSARKVEDGRLIWQRDLEEEFPGARKTRGYATSPLMLDDKLVLIQGAPDAAVLALNPEDGSIIWQRHSFSADYASAIAVSVAGRQQLVCQMEKEVIGLEPTNGDLLWHAQCPTENTRQAITPVDLEDGSIIVATTYGVERLKLSRDKAVSVWKSRKIKAQIGNLMHVRESGILLGANGTRSGSPLVAVDVETGELLWRTRDLDCGFLWQVGNEIFCLPPDGDLMLALVDREGPTVITKGRPFKGPQVWSAPAMMGSVLFVKDAEKLVALNLSADSEPGPKPGG